MEFMRLLLIAALVTACIAAAEDKDKAETVEVQKPQELPVKDDTLPAATSKGDEKIKVTEMKLTEEEINELMTLGDELSIVAEDNNDVKASVMETQQRTGRNVEQRKALKQAAEALTDAEITEIVKMISFPTENEEITEDVEIPKGTVADEAEIEPRSETDNFDEPKQGGSERTARAHGYYILAFSPIDGPMVPFTKLDIIPVEDSLYNPLGPMGRMATPAAADRDDDVEYVVKDDGDDEDSRVLSRSTFSRYIRKMMRQIRKGTRKVQRKTRFKSNSEPTVENFVRSLWKARQEQQQPNSYLFSLG